MARNKIWDGKPKRGCQVCGKPYEFRLQVGGEGKDRWCRHDDEATVWETPDGLRHADRRQIAKARPKGLARNEVAVKNPDGIIHILERGG